MQLESHAVETGDPKRPFLAQVTLGTRSKREVLAQFEAPSLEAAQRNADDWLDEYCARVGLGSAELLQPEVMLARWRRFNERMPDFPKPCAAYQAARSQLGARKPKAAAPSAAATPPVIFRARARSSYASRSRIITAVSAARAAGIDVSGIRLWPDGSMAVFDSRLLASDQSDGEDGVCLADEEEVDRA